MLHRKMVEANDGSTEPSSRQVFYRVMLVKLIKSGISLTVVHEHPCLEFRLQAVARCAG
jgi:hypothetical protein